MIGLDISENNGYIDFTKLKREKPEIEFLIIRIGWIGNKNNHTIDKYFESYYQRAKENGYKIGFYVYNYCRSVIAIDSACQWIEKQIKGKNFELPLYLDMEDNSIADIGKDNLTRQCTYFCNYFEKRGIKTGIYANKNWYYNYLNYNELSKYSIWLAEWNNKITFSGKVDIWQYSSNYMFNNKRFDINKNMTDINYTQPVDNNVNKEKSEVYVDMKQYKNGSTKEPVYSDTALTHYIGFLNPYEQCDCLGIQNDRPIVKYKVDNSLNYKIGFVKWLGGIKQC